DANLTSAIFSKTTWTDVDVTGADFTDAILDRVAVNYLCETASGTNPVTGNDTRESLGCRN
ncbi:MAG: pentapeptide repeat-containing protein, partial [Cyanobacteria bacterium J06639_1]